MTEFVYSLATPEDDGEIQMLLRRNPVQGPVAISYERFPSYFIGCDVMGQFHQTLVVRHLPSGQLAGLAARAARPLFVNGREMEVGYLGQLRVDQRFRSRWLVSGGFRFLRELHGERPVGGYLTTIIEGNREAEGVLVRRARRHFPHYRQIDRLHTLALSARLYPPAKGEGVEVRPATAADLGAMIPFFHRYGAGKQFFPVLREEDFLAGAPLIRDLRPEDFLLAFHGGQLCGVVGLWDQSAYKQTVVRGYAGPLRWGRQLYNGLARLRGDRPLPAPGERLSLAYAAFACVAGNSPGVYDRLLRAVCTLAAQRGHGRVLVGLTERDPLLAVARRYPHHPYVSRLFSACWQEDNQFHDNLDGRICHVEIATL